MLSSLEERNGDGDENRIATSGKMGRKYKTYRAIGRPKRIWEEEINEFLKPEDTGTTTGDDMEVYQRMDQSGKKPRKMVNVGKRICKDSRRKICGHCATQRKPTTRPNPTSTILERG